MDTLGAEAVDCRIGEWERESDERLFDIEASSDPTDLTASTGNWAISSRRRP